MKKYNQSTGGYKIDLYVNGIYLYSTDRFKTLKAAKHRCLELYPIYTTEKVTAKFDRI